MITIGCAGFAVPATRYFKEYLFVEVQETQLQTPGPGTLRRWRREAPQGFEFALLGPKQIGQEGFRLGKVIESALDGLEQVAEELDATTAVFVAPPEFAANRANKAALKEFLVWMQGRRFRRVVFELGEGWKADEADAIAEETGSLAARDPLLQGPSRRPEAYYRLPGPAGYKSRYEDPAIERLAEVAREAVHEHATYVFANVDTFADAKRFKKQLGL
ncbi:MAG: DUF72 domain-containing protein [Polyangiaceae bacterium]|nr:DUF72 domain-containing protein [Polyangiaceae bacterium]MCW5791081.1 DUF72 domain-containing protein [Polyangiaceae bacterium]